MSDGGPEPPAGRVRTPGIEDPHLPIRSLAKDGPSRAEVTNPGNKAKLWR